MKVFGIHFERLLLSCAYYPFPELYARFSVNGSNRAKVRLTFICVAYALARATLRFRDVKGEGRGVFL